MIYENQNLNIFEELNKVNEQINKLTLIKDNVIIPIVEYENKKRKKYGQRRSATQTRR